MRDVIDNIVPCKTKRVEANCFDGNVLENIKTRDKLFKRFQKSRLHIDKKLYKKAKSNTLKTKRTMENQNNYRKH